MLFPEAFIGAYFLYITFFAVTSSNPHDGIAVREMIFLDEKLPFREQDSQIESDRVLGSRSRQRTAKNYVLYKDLVPQDTDDRRLFRRVRSPKHINASINMLKTHIKYLSIFTGKDPSPVERKLPSLDQDHDLIIKDMLDRSKDGLAGKREEKEQAQQEIQELRALGKKDLADEYEEELHKWWIVHNRYWDIIMQDAKAKHEKKAEVGAPSVLKASGLSKYSADSLFSEDVVESVGGGKSTAGSKSGVKDKKSGGGKRKGLKKGFLRG